jgi:hypothetical protein
MSKPGSFVTSAEDLGGFWISAADQSCEIRIVSNSWGRGGYHHHSDGNHNRGAVRLLCNRLYSGCSVIVALSLVFLSAPLFAATLITGCAFVPNSCRVVNHKGQNLEIGFLHWLGSLHETEL